MMESITIIRANNNRTAVIKDGVLMPEYRDLSLSNACIKAEKLMESSKIDLIFVDVPVIGYPAFNTVLQNENRYHLMSVKRMITEAHVDIGVKINYNGNLRFYWSQNTVNYHLKSKFSFKTESEAIIRAVEDLELHKQKLFKLEIVIGDKIVGYCDARTWTIQQAKNIAAMVAKSFNHATIGKIDELL